MTPMDSNNGGTECMPGSHSTSKDDEPAIRNLSKRSTAQPVRFTVNFDFKFLFEYFRKGLCTFRVQVAQI